MAGSLLLLLCLAAPGDKSGLENLDFAAGTLNGWQGQGFYVTTATGNGPTIRFGVCSSDNGVPGRTASLMRSIAVPSEGGVLRCTAFAQVRKAGPSDGKLDVTVVGPDKRIVPKRVLLTHDSIATPHVQTATSPCPQEYEWDLSAHGGQTVQIVLKDEDARQGCHLFCSGFRLIPVRSFEGQDFGQFMVRLAEAHHLAPMTRYDSKHFAAVGNGDDATCEMHLHYCEMIYSAYYEHFRGKGFRLTKPQSKLMVAVFDSQAGFEAYLARKMPALIAGVYDRRSNRLVVYDFGQNNAFLASKKAAQEATKGIGGTELERQRVKDTLNRQVQDFRNDTNLAALLHEAAHQLSFNSGMLKRDGDVPFWLGEGLACYCEATDNGGWQGIGALNAGRLASFRKRLSSGGKLISLDALVASDDWVRGQSDPQTILLGYAQSWALFRMFMEERPKALQTYLELIQARKTPDYRLDDFRLAFGNDLDKLQKHFADYVKQLLEADARR